MKLNGLVHGSVLAIGCVNLCAGQVELFVPLYAYPLDPPPDLWVGVQAVAEQGASITAILNPESGQVNNLNEDGVNAYTSILEYLGRGSANAEPVYPSLTLLCYVYTLYGERNQTIVEDNIDAYMNSTSIFNGSCDGIFFDEAAESLSDVATRSYYQGLHDYAKNLSLSVVFNPGRGADPGYFEFDLADPPGLVSFENDYSVVRSVGMPTPPPQASAPSQNILMVHSADELGEASEDADVSALLEALVNKAYCKGWGKIYITDDILASATTTSIGDDGNPWNNQPSFWDNLVAVTSETPTCADDGLRVMVRLEVGTSVEYDSIKEQVSPEDYGDVVSVVVDITSSSSTLSEAEALRDAGARVLCYVDANTTELAAIAALLRQDDDLFDDAPQVCGGFYVANLAAGVATSDSLVDFYVQIQATVPGSTMVLELANSEEVRDAINFPWNEANDSAENVVSSEGLVIGAILADAADGIDASGESSGNAAVLVTGFTGTAECALSGIAAQGYGYGYVTDEADFTALSGLWPALVTNEADCTSSEGCNCFGLMCLKGGDMESCTSGLTGDPHLVGLRGQKFDFTGRDGEHYSVINDGPCNVINMRVTALPGTPQITYITALGLTLCGEGVEAKQHTVEIVVTDPHDLASKCPDVPSDEVCLAEGSITVLMDGEEVTRPGEYETGDGVSVAAVNIPGECRPFGFEKYWLAKQRQYDEAARSTANANSHRTLLKVESTPQWLLRDSLQTNPSECREYVHAAAEAGTLFEHASEHTSFQITSSRVSLRVNHGKVHQLAMRDPTDTIDLPDHVAYQMNIGFERVILGDNPQGTIGETVRPVLDETGQPIMTGIEAIRGDEEDYLVGCLLCSDAVQF